MTGKALIVRALESCNAGCFMCEFAFSKDDYRLSAADMSAILRQHERHDIRLVRLTGGEPLLLPELGAIINVISSRGLASSVITNGWALAERGPEMLERGLDQVVVSIDGATAAAHDRFRRLPGLFARAFGGIREMRASAPRLAIRANTVVGPHNLESIVSIYELLKAHDVDQWSLIPLKRAEGAWEGASLERLTSAFERLSERVGRDGPSRPKILGYGLHPLGRSPEERARTWASGRALTPRGSCEVVDRVIYLVPKQGAAFPCNCVPHRTAGMDLATAFDPMGKTAPDMSAKTIWLARHGPATCGGCEPINAALGEGAIDLDANALAF